MCWSWCGHNCETTSGREWRRCSGLCEERVVGSNDRNFIEAVLWWRRTGVPWRDLPEDFGPWKTVFKCFDRWSKRGKWTRLFDALRTDPDDEWHSLDSTINRAHPHAAGGKGGSAAEGIGRSRGGLTTKVHLVVDALGLPLTFEITEGQRNDIVPAKELIGRVLSRCLLADKAYDARDFRESLDARGCVQVIPSNRSRSERRP
jgi:transposase